MAPFFILICISNFLLAASVSLSLYLSPCPLAFACALCLAKSIMKETYWSACWKDSSNKIFIAVLLPASQKNKVFQRGRKVHSLSCVLFSFNEWLEHVFYCADLQNNVLVLSPRKNIVSVKIGLENVFAAYWFNSIFSIVNNAAETCIILLKSPVQGIKEQYSENKRKYYFLQ